MNSFDDNMEMDTRRGQRRGKNYMNNKSEEANKFDFNNDNEEEKKEHMAHLSFSGMGLVGELKTDTLR